MSQSITDWSSSSGSTVTSNFSVVPAGSYTDDAIPNVSIQPAAFPQGILDDPSASAVTTTANPSLTSTPVGLAATGGAAGNTVSANPTIYSSGSSGVVSDISQIGNTIGQWGIGIASLVGVGSSSNSGTVASSGLRTSSVPNTAMTTQTKYIIAGVLLLVVIVLFMDAE
jgi:hypothetical protein